MGFAWMQQIFEAGALEHFDRVTIHPYRSDAPETAWADLDKAKAHGYYRE